MEELAVAVNAEVGKMIAWTLAGLILGFGLTMLILEGRLIIRAVKRLLGRG